MELKHYHIIFIIYSKLKSKITRRALNALRKRRADKHMICCLSLTAIILFAAGGGAVASWILFAKDIKYLGPLIILGPILVIAGLLIIGFSIEICLRLKKQVARVMDPSLLKTSNFHEVKHWIEPGKARALDSQKVQSKSSPSPVQVQSK